MMHVSLYRDILVSAVAYDSETRSPRVHIDVHDGESERSMPPRLAYLDISPKQARKLAAELIVAADCCGGSVKGWDFIEGNKNDTAENV